MALQSSGQISLDDIHVEAGGSTGSEATINDSDIRDLIGASSGAELEFADFYGATATDALSSYTMDWEHYNDDASDWINPGSIKNSSYSSFNWSSDGSYVPSWRADGTPWASSTSSSAPDKSNDWQETR